MYSWDTFSSSYIILHTFLFRFICPVIAQSCGTVMYFCKSDFHFATLIQGSLEKEGERLWIVSLQSLPVVLMRSFPSPLFPELTFLLFLWFSFSFCCVLSFLTVFFFQICKSSYCESEKKKRKNKACITVDADGRPWGQQKLCSDIIKMDCVTALDVHWFSCMSRGF